MPTKYTTCAIDLETGGLDCMKTDVGQVAIVPFDSSLHAQMNAVLSIRIKMKRYTKKALEINGLDPKVGVSKLEAFDAFLEWKGKHHIGKIIPLYQNGCFDISFLKYSLWSDDIYRDNFHYHYKDTMILAQAINDSYIIRGETKPFRYVSLKNLCKALGISYNEDDAHEGVYDCIKCLEVYHELMSIIRK